MVNYMFDELSADEKKKVEEYLAANPEVAAEIDGLSDTRKVMTHYEDKEIIPPASFTSSPEKEVKVTHTGFWYKTLAVAASVSLLMLLGYITGFQASYDQEGLMIGFNRSKDLPKESVTIDQIEVLLNNAMAENRNKQQSELVDFKEQFKEEYTDLLKDQKAEINASITNKLAADKRELDRYAQDLTVRNAQLVNQYFTNSGLEQQAYVKNLLIDFTGYLEEQRVQDRDFYLNRLIDLKLSSDLKQQETEQLLTTIMNSVNNLPNEETTQNF